MIYVCVYDLYIGQEAPTDALMPDTDRDIWVCLVCGYVGCGCLRGGRGHIRAHYNDTQHTYAMNTDSRLVWYK